MEITPRARRFFAVTFIAMMSFIAVSLFTAAPTDWPFDRDHSFRQVSNLAGPFGSFLAWTVFGLFGRFFSWLIPLGLLGLAANMLRGGETVLRRWVWKSAVAAVLLAAFFSLTPVTRDVAALHGWLGDRIAASLRILFGEIGSTIVLVAVVLLITLGEIGRVVGLFGRGSSLLTAVARAFTGLGNIARARALAIRTYFGEIFERLREPDEYDELEINSPDMMEAEDDVAASATAGEEWMEPAEFRERDVNGEEETPLKIVTAEVPGGQHRRATHVVKAGSKKRPLEKAALPPPTLLDRGGDEAATYSREELRNWSTVLEEKLYTFGVEGKVTSVHHGPVVTTFEFEPAPGVRIKDITSRADDLALAMRARSLRMIAPIPGRAAVGIEIPNPKSRTVYLYDVLTEITDMQRMRGIPIALGVDVVGKPFVMNLCDTPHLLIAGTTGSGKSVCLNCILASILFQYRPTDVKLLLVDPKIVEMSVYNGIPHLLHPVITDPKEAAKVLEYLVAEMSRRNELFRRHGVRNIESFNQKLALGKAELDDDDEPLDKLPYIVVVVDELGDLALAKGVDIETLLARLAQMARAAGIHMVLATQRPSVDVIVGKTKANFPTRIAFRVATKVDSRTILDTIGADKLLGKGDMLYMDAQNPQPLRLHGPWLSEKEIEQLIEHWKSYQFDESNLDLSGGRAGAADLDEDLDPLFEDAKGVVFQYKQGSTSLLQRKLHVGYARAARLLDQLESRGVVGPPDGSKPREVYLDAADLAE